MPIPTMECRLVDKQRMTSGLRCEVKSAVNCNCTHTEQCVDIVYQECKEVAKPLQCTDTSIRVPFQPKEHRVKCLLEDTLDTPNLNVEESARDSDIKLETNSAK